MNSEKVLLKFLKEWLVWATKGYTHYEFRPYTGLCVNLLKYVSSGDHPAEVFDLLRNLLWEEFGEESDYPFGGIDEYFLESSNHLCHKNPQRIEWVKKTIKSLEEMDE